MSASGLTAYGAIFGARFRVLLQYRAAAAAGLVTQLFWGLIRVMIIEAFYRSSTSPQPMSFGDLVSYIWLGQATLLLIPWNVDTEVRSQVRTGGIAYEWLRPLDLYWHWFARSVALRTAPTLLRAIPVLLLASLFFGLRLPSTGAAACGWLVLTGAAVLLSSAITTLLNISLLWTVSGDGIARLMPTVAYLFSGMILPLPLYPDWAQKLINFLPFRGLIDVPFRVYLGHLPAQQVPALLLQQLIWIAVLIGFGRWLLGRARLRLVVQGG
jgi:ABC-2 type transport system permease protein